MDYISSIFRIALLPFSDNFSFVVIPCMFAFCLSLFGLIFHFLRRA